VHGGCPHGGGGTEEMGIVNEAQGTYNGLKS